MQRVSAITCVRSTFIDSLNPDKNFSNEDLAYVGQSDNERIFRALFSFNSEDFPPEMEKCLFKLFIIKNSNIDADSQLAVYNIANPWTAAEVTWNNQPEFSEENKKITVINNNLWEEITWDVTNIVRAWKENPNKNFGLLVKMNTEDAVNGLYAFLKENKGYKYWWPKIEITYETVQQKNSGVNKPKIAILSSCFYEWDGGRCFFSGREKYLVDLIKLFNKLGYYAEIFQPSIGENWERIYSGVTVKGININDFNDNRNFQLNKKFYELTKEYHYHIYFGIDVAFPFVFPGSICIGYSSWQDLNELESWKPLKPEQLMKSLDLIDIFICIDTKFLSWLNAVKPDLKGHKIYLPNYVDLNIFRPIRTRKAIKRAPSRRRLKPMFNRQHINILYPRRLHSGRGWPICKDVAQELVKQYRNIKFLFVGRGSEDAEQHMKMLAESYPRIEYTWFEMEDMYKAYQEADIVLIPSLYSAGTSLALLEAMACGKAIIAGLGITDLIIHGYNGYLINVNRENLKSAILEIVENSRLRRSLGYNARLIAENYSKDLWENRWLELLNKYFPK